MARFKTMLATLAATGLVIAQPAAAAARTGAAIGDGEALSDMPEGSGAVVGLLGLLGLIFLIMAITDDDGPSSP